MPSMVDRPVRYGRYFLVWTGYKPTADHIYLRGQWLAMDEHRQIKFWADTTGLVGVFEPEKNFPCGTPNVLHVTGKHERDRIKRLTLAMLVEVLDAKGR